MLRQPIVTVLGHVDHGKTSLLDRIRKSSVAAREAGGITQAVGATEIPLATIKELCRGLIKEEKIKIPGLLFIDTPGHEAFTTLRRRGGSIADLAILVVDVTEGFQPQTLESLMFLREFKVPFVVAANKIDKIRGWVRHNDEPFLKSYAKQNADTKSLLDNKVYELMGQLSNEGFVGDRFDRINDFSKNVAIVPVCAVSAEGVPELLSMLIGLAQQFLTQKITIQKEIGCGAVLEVKENKGLGKTIDVILYDGQARVGDTLIIGSETPIVTTVKALLKPKELGEMRVERVFRPFDVVVAASGVKVSAPELDGVIPGSPVRFVQHKRDVPSAQKEVQQEVSTVEFETHTDGVLIKADTLGSLEAMIKILTNTGIPIRKARIGPITRAEMIEQKGVAEPYNKVIFAFNVGVTSEAAEVGEGVRVFENKVIYKLIEDYDEWVVDKREQLKLAKLDAVVRPCKLALLKGFVFRASKPAIVGVEILSGVLRPGAALVKEGKIVGNVSQIQHEGTNVAEAKRGDRVALSIDGPTVGRQIVEGDVLFTAMSKENLRKLEELKALLTRDELDLLEEIKNLI